MHIERLQALIQVLQNVQALDKKQGHTHFNMRYWKREDTLEVTCDTSACAFGWMALSERGKADGIILQTLPGDDSRLFPYYDGEYGFTAAAIYFGISVNIAEQLFGETSYGFPATLVKPQNVIDRVEYLLGQGEVAFRGRDDSGLPGYMKGM